MIPSIGQPILFYSVFPMNEGQEPQAGEITKVWSDTMVNVKLVDNGAEMTSVYFKDEPDNYTAVPVQQLKTPELDHSIEQSSTEAPSLVDASVESAEVKVEALVEDINAEPVAASVKPNVGDRVHFYPTLAYVDLKHPFPGKISSVNDNGTVDLKLDPDNTYRSQVLFGDEAQVYGCHPVPVVTEEQ